MEDEEVAESWEEAADSGVRANDMSRIFLITFEFVKWPVFVIQARLWYFIIIIVHG